MLTKEQLAIRPDSIGGSDAPALVMCDDYRQPLDVYHAKIGRFVEIDDLEDRVEAVRWGNLLEDIIAKEWSHRHHKEVARVQDLLRHPDPGLSFMTGNIDRRLVNKDEGLEIKARGLFAASDYGPSGTDQVKESDIIQCQHYMAITGWSVWNMAVLIGGQELRSYVIPRDNSLISNLEDTETAFWGNVQARTPPELLYNHRSTVDILKKMYPGSNGQVVELGPDVAKLQLEIDALSTLARTDKKELDALKNERAAAMGENAVGRFEDGGGLTRKLTRRKGFTVAPTEFFTVRYSKSPKLPSA